MKGWVGLVYWRFTHISGHPSAVGWAQDSESSPVKDQRSTAEPRNQLRSIGTAVLKDCNQVASVSFDIIALLYCIALTVAYVIDNCRAKCNLCKSISM